MGITFVPSGTSGDLILDTAGGAIDPDTQIEIEGIVYDFTFELSGLMPTTKNNGSQQVPDQFEGNAVYIVTVQDYPTAGETTRLAVLPDDLATQAEMDSFGNGAIDVQNVDTTSSGVLCRRNANLNAERLPPDWGPKSWRPRHDIGSWATANLMDFSV